MQFVMLFLFSSGFTQIFIPFSGLKTPMGIITNEAKEETEIHSATTDTKIKDCSM